MIEINQYSRPGKKLHQVMAIVLHWPAWANRSAKDVYDYFGDAIPVEKRFASSQYVIGLSGEVVQIMPESEVAYHCGSSQIDPESKRLYTDKAREIFGKYAIDHDRISPNLCTIGIEVCHVDNMGNMTAETIEAVKTLCADLCFRYGLDPTQRILRHYDVVGWKNCPRYWYENPDKFDELKSEIALMVKEKMK